jgi:hypothetical protein
VKRIIAKAIPVAMLLAGSAFGSSALAQGMRGKTDAARTAGPGYEVTEEMRRYRGMAGVMRDMSQQMNRMQERMAQSDMSPEMRKRMKQQLKEMSDLMGRMAGLADRPSMSDPEMRKHTEEMRKQMDAMMRAHP